MTELFIKIVHLSITASYVALVVLLVRLFLKRSPKIFSYMLWGVVLFRLVCPFDFSSSFSLLRPFNTPDLVPRNIGMMEDPIILPAIDGVNSGANHSLPAAVSAIHADPMQILLSLSTALWMLGMALLILYSIYSYVKVYRKIQFATLVRENIYQSDQIGTPFVFGGVKPKIYLPKGLHNNELDYIIRHERTHIRRYDYLIKPISFLVLIVHWFNPILWICYYLMIKDMEMSCDESVLKESSEDLRGDYSSSLLTVSVKRSNLLLPLAFGESNIKSRIKNILNYKKPSFWRILIPVILVIAISIGLITNPLDEPAKERAEEFLKTYYTIENTELADAFSDSAWMDKIASSDFETSQQGVIGLRGFNEEIGEKYGDLMTEEALNRSIANRTILAGELAAKEYGSKLIPEKVDLIDENTSNNRVVNYQYRIGALVRFKDNSKESVTLQGALVMEEVEGTWKVKDFQPDREELTKVLQFVRPNLIITNHSNVPIRLVEVSTEEHFEGAMNADNSDLKKNAQLNFEMEEVKDLQFLIRLSDGEDNTLLQKSFIRDFSNGKDVHLSIQEDQDGNLILR